MVICLKNPLDYQPYKANCKFQTGYKQEIDKTNKKGKTMKNTNQYREYGIKSTEMKLIDIDNICMNVSHLFRLSPIECHFRIGNDIIYLITS